MTDFITLTEMWHDQKYLELGDVMHRERWSPARVAEFCAYFCKYVGTEPLKTLYKFI